MRRTREKTIARAVCCLYPSHKLGALYSVEEALRNASTSASGTLSRSGGGIQNLEAI